MSEHANYLRRVGFSRCIRCDFTTEGIESFTEQDKALDAHLAEKHPGWMTDGYQTVADWSPATTHDRRDFEREAIELVAEETGYPGVFIAAGLARDNPETRIQIVAVKAVRECARRLKAEALLREFGRHKISCPHNNENLTSSDICRCGWNGVDESLARRTK